MDWGRTDNPNAVASYAEWSEAAVQAAGLSANKSDDVALEEKWTNKVREMVHDIKLGKEYHDQDPAFFDRVYGDLSAILA